MSLSIALVALYVATVGSISVAKLFVPAAEEAEGMAMIVAQVKHMEEVSEVAISVSKTSFRIAGAALIYCGFIVAIWFIGKPSVGQNVATGVTQQSL